MANTIDIKVDTREFDRVFREYMNYSSRDLVEAVNQHAYYMARDCVNLTKAVDKGEIENELNAPSEDYSPVPLAAILVQKERAEKGLMGLTGEAMRVAIGKLIRKRQASRNFLRAGWIPAVKLLAAVVPKRGGSSLKNTKMRGKPKGWAKAAVRSTFNWAPLASIWNSIEKGDNKTGKILQEGAQAAIAKETQSMKNYIENKQQQRCKQFWGS